MYCDELFTISAQGDSSGDQSEKGEGDRVDEESPPGGEEDESADGKGVLRPS
jgi:hypothetical protein